MNYMKKSIKLNILVVVCMVSILFGNLNLKNVDAKKHITLSKKSVTLKKGKTIKVRLIGAATKKVKWRSLNKRVAVVKNGKIMAKNVGNTAVVAKYKNKNYRCSVKVVRNKIVIVPTEKPQSTHKPEPTTEPTYRPEPTVEPTRETEPTNKPQENEKTNDTELEPYQTYGAAEYNKSLQMAGYVYQNSVVYNIYSSSNGNSNYVLYNLDNKYDKLSFTYGHYDGKYRDDCILLVYGDGKLLAQYTDLKAEMMPRNVTIDVSGVSQLKIDCQIASGYAGLSGTYGLSNIKFHEKNSNEAVDISTGTRVVDISEPYQTYGAVEYNKSVQMAGYMYQNSVVYNIYSSSNGNSNSVIYNLDNKCDKLSFTYGHYDGKYRDDCILLVYGDGKLLAQYTDLKAEMMPQNVTIDVSGVSQLKIDCQIASGYAGLSGTYGLSNIKFHEKNSSELVSISTGTRVVDISEPYQTYGAVEYNKSVQMAGYMYQNSVVYNIYSSSNGNSNSVIYNLDNKCNMLSFTYGHCDDKYKDDCILLIYGDGKLLAQYTDLKAEMIPKNVTIDVSGVSQLKIDCQIASEYAGLSGTYALVNLNIR
ncbi:hypothetical protein DWZ63_09285 [Clostridium sp. AF34-13]|nr:hypothetical protein DWZ63_09285 [Clostridium sp. AF34-13]